MQISGDFAVVVAAPGVLVETYSGEEITKRQREVQAHYKATLRQSDEVESEGKHGPIHDWGADKNVSLRTTKGVE